MTQVAIQDTLNHLTTNVVSQLQEDEILMMLKMQIRKMAAKNQVKEEDVKELLQNNLEELASKWKAAFIKLDIEQYQLLEADSDIPEYLREYRYKASGIVEIYKNVLKKNITKKTIYDHMLPDQLGISKLKKISIKGERDSVLETDVLEYFYTVAKEKLKPEQIRKYHYKAPVK